MEFIKKIIDFVLHLDTHLSALIQSYGVWTYVILFVVIFCETGFVVTPFLPGDSLLFAAGTFAARGALKVGWLFLPLRGRDHRRHGQLLDRQDRRPEGLPKEKTRIFKKEYLDRTHAFYEKYGGETIIIARFVPIVRTFAPFVAGIGRMSYGKFITYNVIGGVGWVVLLVGAGYFFGNIPFVKKNFSLVIIAIIVISLVPVVVEFLQAQEEEAVLPDREPRP